MPQIGPLEILVVAAIALMVFGPEKLPEIARTIGRTANQLRRMASEVKDEFEFGLDDADDEPAAPIRHQGTRRPATAPRATADEPRDPATPTRAPIDDAAGASPSKGPTDAKASGAPRPPSPSDG